MSLGRDRLAQPSGEHPQEIVADGVAEAVVDQLEVVHVDEQHRGRRAGAGGLCQIPLQLLGELQPVGQVGERVVVGEVGKPSLGVGQSLAGLVTVGDVGDDAFHQHPPVGKPRAGAIPHPAGAAVEPQQPVLELHRPALAEGVVEARGRQPCRRDERRPPRPAPHPRPRGSAPAGSPGPRR